MSAAPISQMTVDLQRAATISVAAATGRRRYHNRPWGNESDGGCQSQSHGQAQLNGDATSIVAITETGDYTNI